MTSVLIFGIPYWASHVASLLDSRVPGMQAKYVPQGSYLRPLTSRPGSQEIVLMRMGFRVGATTVRGRLFDAYWSALRRAMPGAVACHYWLGTDVQNTLEEAKAGTLRRAAITSSRDDLHLAGAPWLVSELSQVNIRATLAPIPEKHRAPQRVAPLPADFSVLTYLPAGRFDFFGGPAIMESARRLPEVSFTVVGSRGESVQSAPANVQWLGWVGDMEEQYARATVVIRIPEHDGLGGTMVEALLHARHVVYTYDMPFVRRVCPATAEGLVAALGEMRDAHAAGRLGPNLAGRAFALEEFDEGKLVASLVALLKGAA